jgi:hypothetical protein
MVRSVEGLWPVSKKVHDFDSREIILLGYCACGCYMNQAYEAP